MLHAALRQDAVNDTHDTNKCRRDVGKGFSIYAVTERDQPQRDAHMERYCRSDARYFM